MKTFPLLCAAIAFFFAAATSSVQALTSGDFTYTATATAVTITAYNGAGGAVTIPSTIGGLPVTEFGTAFKSKSTLTSVTIPNSVTSIGNNAFSICSSLTSVTISNSVTSIGTYAFYSCGGLRSLTIPNSVTSIGSSAFFGCNGLTSMTLGNGVTSIGSSAFQSCSSLMSVTIPDSVTSIGDSAFSSCSGLTSVTVDVLNLAYSSADGVLFDKSKATLIYYPPNKAVSYTIPDSVTSIAASAFYSCSSLTSVTIPNSVTSIGASAFYSCSSLKSVTIPDRVISIGSSAFTYCSGLTSVTIPSSVNSIGTYAFQSCTGLKSMTIPNSITSIGNGVFTYCSGLKTVTIPNSVTYIGNAAFDGCSILTSVIIPDSVISIGDYAFNGCGLKSVTIGSGVTSIGNNAFSGNYYSAEYFFRGNAPIAGTSAFSGATIYYLFGAINWGITYAGLPTVLLVNPAITKQPVGSTVNQAASASFSVTASGGFLTYQWQKDGVDIVGATAATLSLSNVQTSDVASYTVKVINAMGGVTSNAALLTVTVPIAITAQPVSVTANLGAPASFSVTATGTSPAYQWKKAGVNITGATTATLSFWSLLSTDAGNYTVVVTNAAGNVTSSAATLTVISPPTISVQPVSVSLNLGASASLSVTATGGGAYTYQWKKDGSDIVGATAATLSFATLLSTDAGSYTVVVTNAEGSVTSNAAILTVVVVPTIAAQPVIINANQGASATFNVTAAGGGTYIYQWKKAGVNITGATAATLTLSNVQPVDAVAYSVAVTNAMGTVTSNAATLTVIVPPVIIDQPTNIIANPGEGAVFSVVTTGSAPTYQWKRNGVIVAGATQADLNFSVIQPVHVGSYKVVVSNAAGSVTSATVSLTLNTVFTQSQYDVIADAARAEITNSPNAHGLYSLNQVQALNVGTPLLVRDAASGKFKLTVKAKKSTDLKTYSDLPFAAGDAVINGNGEMEFQFLSPDNAAFF